MTRMQAAARVYCQLYASGMAAGLEAARQVVAKEGLPGALKLARLDAEKLAVKTTAAAWKNSDAEFRQYVAGWLTAHARVLLGLSRGEELAAEDAADFLNAACAAVNAQKRAAPAGAQPKTEHEGNHAHDKN